MKTYFFTIAIVYFTFFPKTLAQNKLNDIPYLFTLEIKTTKQGETTAISLKPTVVKNRIDRKFRRRFEYILYNKTSFSDNNYLEFYPDTLKMNQIFRNDIKSNKDALTYLKYFYTTLQPKLEPDKKIFSVQSLMKIASKFFLVTGYRDKNLLDWRICIGINGQKNTSGNEDHTLLEAFCFEAIFENLKNENQDKNHFMNKFLEYIALIENENSNLDKNNAIVTYRNTIFNKMESEITLKNMLLDYYHVNINNLPFRIR